MIRVLVRDGANSIGMGVEKVAHQGVPAAANQRQRTNYNVQNDPFHGTIMVVSSEVLGTAGRMRRMCFFRRTYQVRSKKAKEWNCLCSSVSYPTGLPSTSMVHG
jgi:hypothetical protein